MSDFKELEVVRMYRLEGDSKVKAFVDIAVGGFIVKGFRILEGKNGLFLGMPQQKSKDGRWFNIFFPATKEYGQVLSDLILEVYQK